MKYQTYKPYKDLASIVKFYWTLEVPFDPKNQKQKIVPDGCIEMTFNFGDKIKRYTSENDFILHPNAMVMGQRTKSYDILPVGNVDTFAICFYPVGFVNFVKSPLENLVDKETPIAELFGEAEANELERQMIQAIDTQKRIDIIETFLLKKLNERTTISNIVKSTVDTLLKTNGTTPINVILKDDISKRKQLERHFKKQIGISPKQLGKAIRLQANLHLLLNKKSETLTDIAYENEYFDQNHFIKDFKELVGVTPKEFLGNENMTLSALFYK
ncbi:MAG: helix-turn-helix domain-containing protein [Bacteroidota bacterium]|uniref:AraC family transcriptional regulator n=1 Tax=Flagellimonas profundi TaxID=2915620 RepID=A0ABS3FCE5_9FLAO|nr:helix-turn-helix domain-containing protein [Allomuricauda profundi]MBO0340833.1 AraC family transcriptional regulator [Allomuricauda profundi]MEC7771997.1 helix-turn-helix domain-containing protein [Bacteroidota bacterium]